MINLLTVGLLRLVPNFQARFGMPNNAMQGTLDLSYRSCFFQFLLAPLMAGPLDIIENRIMEKLHVNMNFNLIQQIRLVHALTESKYPISIPTEEESKFNALKKRFGVQFVSNDGQNIDISSHLNISHADPLTSVGQILRPLIFPHSISTYCRSLWVDKRKHRYSFQGLVTETRKKLLENWIEDKLNKKVCLKSEQNILSKVKTKIFSRIGLDTTRRRNLGELLVWESERGRKFPIKAWDDEYFRILANSEFVGASQLCAKYKCLDDFL